MTRARALLPPLLFVAAAGLPLLRQRGNPSWDSIWGEDGFLLFQDVLDSGIRIERSVWSPDDPSGR